MIKSKRGGVKRHISLQQSLCYQQISNEAASCENPVSAKVQDHGEVHLKGNSNTLLTYTSSRARCYSSECVSGSHVARVFTAEMLLKDRNTSG